MNGLARMGARIREHAMSGNRAASLVTAALGSDDVERFAADTGHPLAVAEALEAASRGIAHDAPAFWQFAARAATAPRCGNATDALTSEIVLALIDGLPPGAASSPVLGEVAAAHRLDAAGNPVPPAHWRKLRASVLAATDTDPATDSPPDPMLAGATRVAEAAAWPVQGSRSIIVDMMAPVVRLHQTAADLEAGWTDADRQRAETVLSGIRQQRKAAGEQTRPADFPALFRSADPDLAARYGDHVARSNAVSRRVRREIGTMMLDRAELPALITRQTLFGNPEFILPTISPDGRWIAFHAPHEGVMNLWIAPRDRLSDRRALTRDTHRGVWNHRWAFDGRHLLYTQDKDGDEAFGVFRVCRETGTTAALISDPGAMAVIAGLSPERPHEVLVATNARDRRFHDLLVIDIRSAARHGLFENTRFAAILCDRRFELKLAIRALPDGGRALHRMGATREWEEFLAIPAEDAGSSGPLFFSRDGRTLFLADSRNREATAIVAIDMASGQASTIAADPEAPVRVLLDDQETGFPVLAAVDVALRRVLVLDPAMTRDVDNIEAQGWQNWQITGRSLDDRFWMIAAAPRRSAPSYHLYDRERGAIGYISHARPSMAHLGLSRMHALSLRSRDGLTLVSYLSLPEGNDTTSDAAGSSVSTDRPLPMVLLVHGGPATRDAQGYSPLHQWLTNRGYAVLSVNFRGSAGFTKSFLSAGDGEWGRRMSDDLDDAVEWAIAAGVADRSRIAIMGTSYGGYAALIGLIRSPERFACGISLAGPSDLQSLMAAIPPHWEAGREALYRSVGDPRTEAGLAALKDRSPLFRVDAIRRPLLVGQGANDPRVPRADTDRLVEAMHANGVAVSCLLYPDEGHALGKPANQLSFNAAIESFLGRNLGGRVESGIPGEFAGASVRVRSGEPWLQDVINRGCERATPPPG